MKKHPETVSWHYVFNPDGLTKREYFAAMALQGLINLGYKADGNADPDFTARDAIEYADALIEKLNSPNQTSGKKEE